MYWQKRCRLWAEGRLPVQTERGRCVERRWSVRVLREIPNGGFGEGVEVGSQAITAGELHMDQSTQLYGPC
jgi:hypothetical protein